MKPHQQTIHALQHLLQDGDLSAVALTESVLEQIDAQDPTIGAYITLDRKGALEQAKAADRQRRQGAAGPLTGIPLSIKDVLCTKGLRTTCGSKMLENFTPVYDATVIENLKRAGAILLGKVSMDEFAMGSANENCAFGTPKNPWHREHICGGSSGGSAASVAADMCIASLGSDTGGSIRQPASFCGVVGLKPTYGRVSRYGLVAFASSLDQIGPLTKDVRDAALLLEAIAGHDPRDSTSVPRPTGAYSQALELGLAGCTIGIPEEYFIDGLDPEVEASVRQGIAALEEAGAKTVAVSLPHTGYGVAAYYIIAPAEASANLSRFDGIRYGYRDVEAEELIDLYQRSRSTGFGPEVKRRIMIGTYALSSGYYDAYYKKASQVRTLIINDFKRAFAQCDILASPVTPTVAWAIGERTHDPLAMYLSDILTIPANLAGLPGISVPCGFNSAGLPIGMQLMANHFQEEQLLRAAYNLENQLQLTQRKPQL